MFVVHRPLRLTLLLAQLLKKREKEREREREKREREKMVKD